MRKIREILRLKFECGLTNRKIAKSASIARSTVGDYVNRAVAPGLSWPLPEAVDDARLEQILFEQVPRTPKAQRSPLYIHKELKRKGGSGVLHSKKAIQINVQMMKAFVQLRHMVIDHAELKRELDELRSQTEDRFKIIVTVLNRLVGDDEKSVNRKK